MAWSTVLLVYVAGGIISLLLSVFLLVTAYIAYVRHKYSHVPSPKIPSFYLGHVPDLVRLMKEHKNPDLPFTTLVEYWFQDVKSKTMVIHFFHQTRIFTVDTEIIKALTQNVENGKCKYFANSFTKVYGERFHGNGLVTICDYETWRPKRRMYDPWFSKSFVKTLVKDLNSLSDDFINELKPLADGETVVPMAYHIRDFILNVVSKIVFGTDFKKIWDSKSLKLTTASPQNPFNYIVDKVFEGGAKSLRSLYAPWIHYFHPFEAKGYQEAVRAFRMMGKDCIQKRIEAIKRGDEVPRDILTNIIRSASMDETRDVEDLVDDFCTFYHAAVDTTASLLMFAVIVIHQHPAVLTRVLEEIGEVLGERSEVTTEDLDSLTYTEQTLEEVHRMFQLVPGLAKCLDSAQTLAGIHFPAKTDFVITSSVMNRMPEYYEEPDVFNPDRFSPKNRPSSVIYQPFGLGHRSCIGKHFAMMEMKLFLARLLQTYSISLPEGYKLELVQKTVLKPKGNIPCVLKLV